jgi:hypothetical protein
MVVPGKVVENGRRTMIERSRLLEALLAACLLLHACGGKGPAAPGTGRGGLGGASGQGGGGGPGAGASGGAGGSAGQGGVGGRGDAGGQGGNAGSRGENPDGGKACGATICSASACCASGDTCGIVVGNVTGPCVVTQPGRLDATCPTWNGGEIVLSGCCLNDGTCGYAVSSDLCFSAAQVSGAPPSPCQP